MNDRISTNRVLYEMDKFLEINKLSKLIQEKIENMNSSIINKDIK